MEVLEEQVIEAASRGRHIACGDGLDFAVWEDDDGAALWIQIQDGAITGAHPFFARATTHRARIEGATADPEDAMGGRARLYLLPEETVLLPVDVVNWPLVAHALRPQTSARVRLVAVAESLQAWDTPDAYKAFHPESRHQGVHWIVPTGLYPEEKGGTGRATATITGVVAGAGVCMNGLTQAPFRHLQLEMSGGALLDVVAANGPLPPVGAVARGHFWLAGFLEPDAPDATPRINSN